MPNPYLFKTCNRTMQRRFQLRLVLLLLGICGKAVGDSENMDELLTLSPAELAEIPVTIATGTATNLSHSAAVTSVITAEQIASMGATELHEVLETIPGMHATLQPVNYDYSYSLRGIQNTGNSQVLMLIDGTRFSVPYQGTHMAGMEIPVRNIQRIEVIRGPGSALYGADAFAGVINIVTKKAADLDGLSIGARGGYADTKSSWAQYGGNWQGWDVAASLQYSHNGYDADRIIQADLQSQLDAALGTRASLAPGPMQDQNERWNGHLNLQRKHWQLGFWAFDTNGGFRAGAAGALDNLGKRTGSNYLADLRYSTEDLFGDWELQAHASFLHTDVNADIYSFPPGAVLPLSPDGNITSNITAADTRFFRFNDGVRFITGLKNTVPSFELTNLYKGFTDHLIRVAGGFRYEELNSQESRNYGPGVIDTTGLPNSAIYTAGGIKDLTGTPYTFIADHHRDIWSIAAQDEWQIAANWQLTTGLRYDHYSDFGNTVNPRAALVWDINSDLTAKILYGRAFRAPSFLEQYQQNSPLFTGNPSLRPETIQTTELAFDYRPTYNLRTALNLYYYEIKDAIRPVMSNRGVLSAANTAGQNGYGSELEWDWRITQDWNFRGNYAWQYARNQDSHSRVSNVPEHHVYGAVAWSFMPKWQIQTQLNWLGHRISDAGDPRILKDYFTIDVTLNAKRLFGHLDLTASARNLFDAEGAEPATSSYPYNLPIPGQSYYLEASVHF